jgi:hypothetical protein
MNSACPAAGFGSKIGAIIGYDSGCNAARQGSHSAQLWGSGWGKDFSFPHPIEPPGRKTRQTATRKG